MEEMTREHYETFHGPNRIGTYACHIFLPGYKLQFRDERWEQIEAFVKTIDDVLDFHYGMTHFYVGIRYRGIPIYCNIIIPNNELERYNNLYQTTLDKIVEQLDTYIKE